MKYNKLLPIVIFFFVFYGQMFGQLSGYFTIGGSGANYQTLPAAIDDLYAQGIDGDVTFALNPGTYPGTTLTEIPGASDENRFILQSGSLDSTDVIINGTVSFDITSHVTITALTITTTDSRAIDFFKSRDISVRNCVINSSYQPNYNEGPIFIRHFTADSAWSSIAISHCIIESPSPCIRSIYGYGSTTVNNCEITSSGEFSISSGKIYLKSNVLIGGLHIGTSTGTIIKGNYVYGKMEMGMIDSIIKNTFVSDDDFHISAYYYEGNHFSEQRLYNGGIGTNGVAKFYNNYFEGDIIIPHANNIRMIGNTFMDDISLGFNHILLFENNRMFGKLNYGDTSTQWWNYRLHNNIFHNEGVVSTGHNSEISYNNFVDGAYLHVNYGDIMVHDNNFCQSMTGALSPENINHNNYFPLIYCYYDTSSVHYDPIYLDSNPGIATNNLLQGKGWSESPEIDFLGDIRKTPPAIGANEIYICTNSMNTIINVPCGEELYLNICNLPDTGSFWWTPDTCITHPDSIYTSIITCDNMTWSLNNSIYGIIKSISIEIEPFEVQIAEMPLFYCGYARTLNASYHPFANYHWIPETGLTNPYIRNPQLLIEDTNNLQYVLECQIDGCGTSYDTINIDFDPLPIVGIYYPTQNADTIFFTCISTCVDEYLWDFGDGTFSNEENPFHIFPGNGIYTIVLTGTNSYGYSSHTVNYNYYWVSTAKELENDKIQIFPNPANESIHIEGLSYGNETKILITDISGSKYIETSTLSKETTIDIKTLHQGIYIVHLRIGLQVITKKIIVMH